VKATKLYHVLSLQDCTDVTDWRDKFFLHTK